MKINNTEITVVKGSVIDYPSKLIVNAANTRMRGGAGVDGAIHAKAGLGMLTELQLVAPHGSFTSIPVLTHGYNMDQDWVLHVAGPRWKDGNSGEPFDLMLCYLNCLQMVDKLNYRLGPESVGGNDDDVIDEIAFPSISTGIFGYPLEKAADKAISSIMAYLNAHPTTKLTSIALVMFKQDEFDAYSASLYLHQYPS